MNKGDIILYNTAEGDISIDVLVENDTVWLTQIQMAQLFNTTKTNITLHVSNVFKEGELEQDSSSKESLLLAPDGKKRHTNLYNLDVTISIGYRVKSKLGTEFRIWANKVLKDYIIKGYAVNDKLKLQQYEELKQTVKLLSKVIQNKEIELSADEAKGLLKVISDYTYGLNYDFEMIILIFMIMKNLYDKRRIQIFRTDF